MRKSLWISVLGIVLFGTYAMADNFYFSFTNTTGVVSGTVTGEIVGLTNNATGPATQVIITSYPPGLSPFETAPFDVLGWDFLLGNQFTEVNGSITTGAIAAYDGAGPCAAATGAPCDFGLFIHAPDDEAHLGYYTPVQGFVEVVGIPAIVPEPSSMVLMSTALIAACVGLGRRIVQGVHKTS